MNIVWLGTAGDDASFQRFQLTVETMCQGQIHVNYYLYPYDNGQAEEEHQPLILRNASAIVLVVFPHLNVKYLEDIFVSSGIDYTGLPIFPFYLPKEEYLQKYGEFRDEEKPELLLEKFLYFPARESYLSFNRYKSYDEQMLSADIVRTLAVKFGTVFLFNVNPEPKASRLPTEETANIDEPASSNPQSSPPTCSSPSFPESGDQAMLTGSNGHVIRAKIDIGSISVGGAITHGDHAKISPDASPIPDTGTPTEEKAIPAEENAAPIPEIAQPDPKAAPSVVKKSHHRYCREMSRTRWVHTSNHGKDLKSLTQL